MPRKWALYRIHELDETGNFYSEVHRFTDQEEKFLDRLYSGEKIPKDEDGGIVGRHDGAVIVGEGKNYVCRLSVEKFAREMHICTWGVEYPVGYLLVSRENAEEELEQFVVEWSAWHVGALCDCDDMHRKFFS